MTDAVPRQPPRAPRVLVLALAVLLVVLPLVALPAVGLAYVLRPKPLDPKDEEVRRASMGRPPQYNAVLSQLTGAGLEVKSQPEPTIRCIADYRSRWSFRDTTSWCLSEGRTVLATPVQAMPFTQQDADALYAMLRALDSRCFHDNQRAMPVLSYQITCAVDGIRSFAIDIYGVAGDSRAGDPWDRAELRGLPHSPSQLPVVITYSRRTIDQDDVDRSAR